MHSIRLKFIAFILAILVALLLLLNTYPITSARDAIFEEKRSSMSAQGSLVSSALSGLEKLSSDGVADVLRFLELGSYSRLIVTDTEGNTVYDDGTSAAELTDVQPALEGKAVFRSVFSNAVFQSSITLPVGTKNSVQGTVCLYETDAERAGVLISMQRQLTLLSLIIGCIAILLAVLFSYLVLRRLNGLVRSMHIVADGDYSFRHSVRGRDEISELGTEFNQLTERLELNELQRRRFVSDASHELKTPIASIRLLSDSILQAENMDRDTMREFLSDIEHEAVRLQGTTEKLLDLSRLDDDVQIVPEPVDLKQITLDALPSLVHLAKKNDVRIETDLSDGCVIMANAEDMRHVVYNLVENAIKYNVPDGSVTIVLTSSEWEVTLMVRDTGIGIPEEDQYNIFTRFYRVDKARSRESGGSGLGLSIVHDAVQAYGGTIKVGNNRPRGSVFIVCFPRPSSDQTGI